MKGCNGNKCETYDVEHSPECLHETAKEQGWEYPTIEDFNAAINEFFIVIDIAGSRSAAIQKIQSMRKLKTSWIGEPENTLRFNIDKILDQFGAGIYGA